MGKIEIIKKEVMHEKCQGLEEGLGIQWRGHPKAAGLTPTSDLCITWHVWF